MATKAEKLAEIGSNVFSIEKETLAAEIGDVKTYDIACLVTINAEGNKQMQTQTLYVKNEGTPQEDAYFGGTTRKNFVAVPEVDKEAVKQQFFLDKLNALETQVGSQVKIDPGQLEVLDIDYLVFEDPTDSKKKITTTLNGTTLIREAI